MMRRILYLIFLVPVFTLLISCSDETEFSRHENPDFSGLPIDFEITYPEGISTRDVENPKTNFSEGDVIHISAEFFDENGEKITSSRYLYYGAMKLTNGKWRPVDEALALQWPFEAYSGNFTTYYICDGKGDVVTASLGDDTELTVDLADVQNDKDPLKASQDNVDYGHAVKLSFRHLCTHLTFTELDYGVTNEYWLVLPSRSLNNAFNFKKSADGNLSFNFISKGDDDFNGLVYINRKFSFMEEGDRIKVGYFLEPGDYSKVELRATNNHPYLSWTSSQTNSLEGNHTYTVNVQQSSGIVITEDTEVEWEDDLPIIVDPEEFLQAIAEQKDYYDEDGNLILRAVENGMILLHCVSFDRKDKEYYESFFADNPAGKIFDGNYHYISDLQFPLFRYNYGTIQNLGIKDLEAEVVSVKTSGTADENDFSDYNRQGALCRWNMVGAIIHNVNMENISMTVKIKNEVSEETHNAGLVTGVNSGSISSVFTKGNFNLTVCNADGYSTFSTVIAGGLVGQNVGTVNDISPLENESNRINVRNECSGNGATLIMGGAVGSSAGMIDHVIVPDVNVYSSEGSSVAIGYVGGLAGDLRSSIDAPSTVTDCMVGGEISACILNTYGEIKSYLYTGGLAGAVMNFSVLNCRSVCNISGAKSALSNVTYACGGAFGRIISSLKIADLTVYGPILTGAKNVGCFAGIVPANASWETTYEPNNNFIRKFDYIPYVALSED